MEQQELTALIGKTAALMEQFERRCEAIEARQAAMAEALQQAAVNVQVALRGAADDALQRIPVAIMKRIGPALDTPAQYYGHAMAEAGGKVQAGTQVLEGQLRRLEVLHRQLVWKVMLGLGGSLALLLAGGGWLALQYRQDIARHQLEAELLRAYNRADVTLCDGRLCANVDQAAAARGEHAQYLPVRDRGAGAGAVGRQAR